MEQPSEQMPAPEPQQAPQPAAQPPAQPKKSGNKTVLIIVIVVVVLFLIGGYMAMRFIRAKVTQKIGQTIGQNLVEKAIEQGTGKKVDVNVEDQSMNIKTNEGSMAVSGSGTIKLPSDFPQDVFVYSDAKISFASSTPANAADGTKASYMVGYGINQGVDAVATKYKDEMAKNGWTKETEANYGALMINFKKADREVLVTIGLDQGDNSGTTTVSVAGN